MLRTLPGWCCLAGKVVARSSRGLLKGRRPCVGGPPQAGLSMSSPGSPHLGPAAPEEEDALLKEWALVVSPFGLLKACLPCHLTVGPLDPHKHPDSDRVLVALRGRRSVPQPASDRPLLVNYEEARKEVTIVSDGMDSTASLDVRIPIKFVFFQSQKIDIRAKGGKVVCLETLQGNTDIHVSQESSVNVEKLQGSSINIASENGLLKAKYLYADSSFLTSVAGDILLGNVHGDITLETKTGSITVDSSEGSLKASTCQGEIDTYVLRQTGEVNLISQEGSITVKVPATLQVSLKLSGTKVEVSPEVQLQDIQTVSREDHVIVTGHMDQKDEKGKWIKAETQYGTVNLKSQSWFQSLKLKIP
ncbi:protein FAM185A isoform 2-T2 [Liasis olivaceus]